MKILAAGRGGRAEFAWADAGTAMGWITDSSYVTLPVQRCFPLKIEADLMVLYCCKYWDRVWASTNVIYMRGRHYSEHLT